MLLLAGQRAPGSNSGIEDPGQRDSRLVCAAAHSGGDKPGLEFEHLRCGPADLVGPGRDDRPVVAADGGTRLVEPDGQHVFGGEEPVDQAQDVLDTATAR